MEHSSRNVNATWAVTATNAVSMVISLRHVGAGAATSLSGEAEAGEEGAARNERGRGAGVAGRG